MLHQINMLNMLVWCFRQPSRADLINKQTVSPDLQRTERSCTPDKAGNVSSMMWLRGWGHQYYWFYYSAASQCLEHCSTRIHVSIETFEAPHIKPPEQKHLPKLLVYEVGSFRNRFSELLMWRATLRVKSGGLLAMGSSTKPCATTQFGPGTVCTDRQHYMIGSEVQAGLIQHNTSLDP